MTNQFSDDGAKRVARQTKRLERAVQGGAVPTRARYPVANAQGRYARTGGGGIPAMSGATLGKASVTIHTMDPDTPETLVATSPAETVDCYNAGGDVAPNIYIIIAPVNGRWAVVVAKCP
jgi:hypothetical protein